MNGRAAKKLRRIANKNFRADAEEIFSRFRDEINSLPRWYRIKFAFKVLRGIL